MMLVPGKEDVVVVAGAYCKRCTKEKLDPLRTWEISREETKQLSTWGTRVVSVKCVCGVQGNRHRT